MANPLSWLAKAGKVVFKVVVGLTNIARAGEPVIAIAVPEVAELYASTVGFATVIEGAFGAGSGDAKLAAVTAALMDYAKQNGWTGVEAEVKVWASAFADSLNKLPFTKTPA